MNIYDVSKRAGVSIATVSRVLNGSPNVSENTRNRILEVMDELGYRPNVFARGLGLGTIQTIGIMCPDSSDPYLAHAIYYLEQGLRSYGYDSILCCTGDTLSTKQKYFDLLLSKKVDAILLAGSKFIEPDEEDNRYILEGAKKVPIILINGYLEGENIYAALCDDRAATYEAVGRLIDSGCRDILYLYGTSSYSGICKLNGYREALAGRGLPVRESYIRQCAKDVIKVRDLLLKLHDEGMRFDAVIASDDPFAVGAVKYAHVLGLTIPEELSIIGYNDSAYAVCTDPELTSIDSKVKLLCSTAIHTLMGVFNGSEVPVRTTIAADLITRATTRF